MHRVHVLARGVAALKDEYGKMDDAGQSYVHDGDFVLDSKETLASPEVRYCTWGTLSEAKDNCVVVCHALTGNANLEAWWGDLLGPGKAFDTSRYFIFCANVLGGCYGTEGPNKIDKRTGKRYGCGFPYVTLRDTVRLHLEVVRSLGVTNIVAVIGGSMGGMQTMEWGFCAPDLVKSLVSIAAGAKHTAWQIAISEAQRQAIYADPKWQGGCFDPADPPNNGLMIAREIAMVTYRTAKAFERKFSRRAQDLPPTKVGSNAQTLPGSPYWETRAYLEYQGKKFLERNFDAVTYCRLTEQMDSFDVGQDRGGCDAALASLSIPVTVIGIDSDVLYPLEMQEFLCSKIPSAVFETVWSDEGHDGFLLEQDQVSAAILRHFDRLAATASRGRGHGFSGGAKNVAPGAYV